MGGGTYSAATYRAVTQSKIDSGTSFAYDSHARATGAGAHKSVSPKTLNKAGINIRECIDTTEHPSTKPMVIGFDQTGSMGHIPREMQTRLKTVFALTTDRGVADVQIAVSAYGDAKNAERAPLQISQFEADNRIDDALDNLYLEGLGGGNNGETANLLWYYLAHYTQLDSFDKRGVKGKLYMIADEVALTVDATDIKNVIGDEPRGDLSNQGIVNDLTKLYDVTILLINNWSAKTQGSEKFYADLFGPDNVVVVESTNGIPELIAGMFAYDAGVDLDSITGTLATSSSQELATNVRNTIERRTGKASGLR